MTPTRVVLGVRDVELKSAIGRKLEEHRSFGLVGAASSSDRVVELTGRFHPDLVVVDERLVGTGNCELERLRAASDAALVVLVERGTRRELPLPHGANAYLTKQPVDDLVRALADVATIAELERANGRRTGRG